MIEEKKYTPRELELLIRICGHTPASFAKHYDYSPSFLSQVLNGEADSKPFREKFADMLQNPLVDRDQIAEELETCVAAFGFVRLQARAG